MLVLNCHLHPLDAQRAFIIKFSKWKLKFNHIIGQPNLAAQPIIKFVLVSQLNTVNYKCPVSIATCSSLIHHIYHNIQRYPPVLFVIYINAPCNCQFHFHPLLLSVTHKAHRRFLQPQREASTFPAHYAIAWPRLRQNGALQIVN